jgi:hypothetical protein
MAEPMKEVAFQDSKPGEATPSTTVAAGLGAAIGGAAGALLGKAAGAPVGASALMGAAVGALAGAVAADTHASEASEPEVSRITSYLQDHLGRDVTAYLSGLDDPEMVTRWASGEASPDPLSSERLQTALVAARNLVDAYSDETAQAWFFGTNEWLGNQAPAYVLRYYPRESWAPIVSASEEFAESAR